MARNDYDFKRQIEKLDGYLSKKLIKINYLEVIENGDVTEGQMELLNRFFKYKTGYSKFKLLDERYETTGLRKVYWKPTGEILDNKSTSKLILEHLNKQQ